MQRNVVDETIILKIKDDKEGELLFLKDFSEEDLKRAWMLHYKKGQQTRRNLIKSTISANLESKFEYARNGYILKKLSDYLRTKFELEHSN